MINIILLASLVLCVYLYVLACIKNILLSVAISAQFSSPIELHVLVFLWWDHGMLILPQFLLVIALLLTGCVELQLMVRRGLLIEICCAPDSSLSAEAGRRGLDYLRISEQDRFGADARPRFCLCGVSTEPVLALACGCERLFDGGVLPCPVRLALAQTSQCSAMFGCERS